MGHLIDIDDVEIGYRSILKRILEEGQQVAPRGDPTLELNDVMIVHNEPSDCLLLGVGRGLSPKLAALEALQLIGGFSTPVLTVQVAPYYANFLDDGRFHGGYGIRTQYKVGLIAERLKRDPDTRRATMTFWDDRVDLAEEGWHDYPCTVSTAFRIRDGKLTAHTHMRSNDAWLGYPYDLVQHSALMRSMARFLGVGVGQYVHTVDSLHLYERNIKEACKLLKRMPSTGERPLLVGGVGLDGATNWSEVQHRARDICYRPNGVVITNSEESWLRDVALGWQK